jgi:two-component system sensor histidine kinase and response regulator WspE
MSGGLEDSSLFDLFRMEAEEQVQVLQVELIQLEAGTASATILETLMRASHSLKGAARIVGLEPIVHLTHAMEDRFVAAQRGQVLHSSEIDRLLAATDWLAKLQALEENQVSAWLDGNAEAIEAIAAAFLPSTPEADSAQSQVAEPAEGIAARDEQPADPPAVATGQKPAIPAPASPPPVAKTQEDGFEPLFGQQAREERTGRERTVRLTAERFDSLVSLTAETMVSARQLAGWADVLSKSHRALGKAIHALQDRADVATSTSQVRADLERQVAVLATEISDFEQVSRANERTAEHLYRTVLAGRLRPFSEGIGGITRLVRDTARELGKPVKLEIVGESTRVDRDILERLEAPIVHLVTNAIDHGIEAPAQRLAAGKNPEARLRIHARHENGRLVVTVRDDGGGIDPEKVRERVRRKNLAPADTIAGLSESELLEFLFLPGFSTRDTTSHLSGRGVGLDVVQSMAQEAGGSVSVTSTLGTGTVFRLTLPVTRSVVRVIRITAGGEPFSVPMVRIDYLGQQELEGDADKPEATWNGRRYPVVVLASILGFGNQTLPKGPVPLLFCGGFAFAVDRFIDQSELSVRRLDPRLGKIPGVSAASLDENGLPLLILDVDDLVQTAAGGPATLTLDSHDASTAPRILVVDDSHTVREMERRLLVRSGYLVSTAQNGQEAWNLLRLNEFDLLISDVDMPQMNGIELVTRVRANPRLSRLPVIIVSYKDRVEDRNRGLEAGADFYLTKGSLENETFLRAVVDLVGTATSDPGDRS